ncbi:hypothetical protein BaRGS_00028098 [Batillaria attramentaria]|uniref:ZU5 domain-containing protein n=1 Tax=Batillaria attramentaria TaxID=370345 RepID=A0ABD0K0V4_9CAEN
MFAFLLALDPLKEASLDGDVDKVRRLVVNEGRDPNGRDWEGKTALHYACSGNNAEIVKILLDHGADPKAIDSDGQTALHLACSGGNTEIVKVLLDHGVDPKAIDSNGRTALHLACSSFSAKAEIVKVLLDHGADPKAIDSNGETALHLACLLGNAEIVKVLLVHGADPKARDSNGKTALHLACSSFSAKAEFVKVLLDHGADPKAIDSDGQTALHLACLLGNAEIVKVLLVHGVDPKAIDSDGKTALHLACSSFSAKAEIVKLLLDHGADPKAIDSNGQILLHRVCFLGNAEIVKVFLDHGADPKARDSNGKTALHLACSSFSAKAEIVKVLLDHGADPKAIDSYGKTALHLACSWGNATIVKILLDHGADPKAIDSDGQTALHLACSGGNAEIVKVLLDHGADPKARDSNGQTAIQTESGCDLNAVNEKGNTALHEACSFGYSGIVQALLDGGADVSIKNKDHKTPRTLAQEHHHTDIEKLLCDASKNSGERELQSKFIFSDSCQFIGEFSCSEGKLLGDSDVILVVPENAIQHPDKVTIAGAVCVDLNTVHDTLRLDQDEVIVSPIVEYVTDREDFAFQKPVQVYLPHFLPRSFSPHDVSVCLFHKGNDGNISTEEIAQVADEDDVENAKYNGGGGTFPVLETDTILVFMPHFTGLFSKIKRLLLGPPELHLRLYGEHIQRNTRCVDLDLLLSDKRLTIRDFRKRIAGYEEEDEKKKIQQFSLPPAINMTRAIFGARLMLEQGMEMWTHRVGFLADKTFNVTAQFDIHSLRWRLQSTESSPPEWFQGRLESGYVESLDGPFQFRQNGEPVSVDLKVNSCTPPQSARDSGKVDGSDEAGVSQTSAGGTSVTGAGHRVGNTDIQDSHNLQIHDSYNTQIPEGKKRPAPNADQE